jgi:hypothetical protein
MATSLGSQGGAALFRTRPVPAAAETKRGPSPTTWPRGSNAGLVSFSGTASVLVARECPVPRYLRIAYVSPMSTPGFFAVRSQWCAGKSGRQFLFADARPDEEPIMRIAPYFLYVIRFLYVSRRDVIGSTQVAARRVP